MGETSDHGMEKSNVGDLPLLRDKTESRRDGLDDGLDLKKRRRCDLRALLVQRVDAESSLRCREEKLPADSDEELPCGPETTFPLKTGEYWRRGRKVIEAVNNPWIQKISKIYNIKNYDCTCDNDFCFCFANKR
jgi:hypothetical protein